MNAVLLVLCSLTLVICGITLILTLALVTVLDKVIKAIKENPLAGLFNNDVSGIGSR